jgi:hypothetical protein
VHDRVWFDSKILAKIVESAGRRNLSQFHIVQMEQQGVEGLLQGVHSHPSILKIEGSCSQGVRDRVF